MPKISSPNGKFDKATVPDLDLLLASQLPGRPKREPVLTKGLSLSGKENKEFKAVYELGESLFHKDGACVTCHQATGQGVINIYPPIVDTEWVNGDKTRLIKLVMHGLWGPITIKDTLYDPQKGVPPMTALGAMYSDSELAAVLTYVRHSWGNNSGSVTPGEVKAVRQATRDQTTFYSPDELLKQHPLPQKNRQEVTAGGLP